MSIPVRSWGSSKEEDEARLGYNLINELYQEVESRRAVLLLSTIHFKLAWHDHVIKEGGGER